MNKTGFTLVELLATIIVIGILSVITTSIMTTTLENSDKDSAKESAYGYVNSLNMEIMESNYSTKKAIKSGYYYTQYFADELGFNVGGASPMLDSWVYIKDGEVKKYSLKFKKYSVTKENENDEDRLDKTVLEHDICFKLDIKYKNLYNYGDSYSCYVGDGKVRTFYLLEDGDSELTTGITEKGKLSLIMKNNLIENYNEEEIEEITKYWINVQLPNKSQIDAVIDKEFIKIQDNYVVSNGANNIIMTKNGYSDNVTNYGYRPVIVINK